MGTWAEGTLQDIEEDSRPKTKEEIAKQDAEYSAILYKERYREEQKKYKTDKYFRQAVGEHFKEQQDIIRDLRKENEQLKEQVTNLEGLLFYSQGHIPKKILKDSYKTVSKHIGTTKTVPWDFSNPLRIDRDFFGVLLCSLPAGSVILYVNHLYEMPEKKDVIKYNNKKISAMVQVCEDHYIYKSRKMIDSSNVQELCDLCINDADTVIGRLEERMKSVNHHTNKTECFDSFCIYLAKGFIEDSYTLMFKHEGYYSLVSFV